MSQNAALVKYEVLDPLLCQTAYLNYEQLEGGDGKHVHFRQKRYNVEELLADVRSLRPRILTSAFDGDLVDFSISGALACTPTKLDLPQGSILEWVCVQIGHEILYQGKARIAHLAACDQGTVQVGLQLLDSIIDVPRVFWLRSSAAMKEELDRYQQLRSRDPIAPAYKAKVSDFLQMLLRYRAALQRREQELEEADPNTRARVEKELLEMAWESFRPTIFELQGELDNLTKHFYFDRMMQEIHRQYTMPILTPHYSPAPFLFRIWHKPLGYPGDYRAMEHIYDRKWEGKTLFAKLMHRYGIEHMLAEAVRCRKELMKRCIFEAASRVRQEGKGRPCRVTSLGSGPAREMVEYLDEAKSSPPMNFTLIDQDNGALTLVNTLLSERSLRFHVPVQANYLYISIKDLIENRKLFESLEQNDLVYCSGLFDYLNMSNAKLVGKALMSRVRPGGELVLGNFAGPPQHAWALSYVLDWNLRYRSREEMLDMASVLEDASDDVRVVTEETGTHFFIRAIKKA